MTVSSPGGALHGRDAAGRVVQLDSMRGIAAVVVVAHHWHMPFFEAERHWFLKPFFAGHEAVILFFVLSGYVLSLPVWSSRQPTYWVYLVRRVSRIYLPYLAALGLACVGCWFFAGAKLPLMPWFYLTWQKPLSVHLILQQVLMDPTPDLNTAFWSLRYEMVMSFVLPGLCVLMLRLGRYSGVVLFVVLRESLMLVARSRYGATMDLNLFSMFYNAMFFVVGASLAREAGALKGFMARRPAWMLWLTLPVAMAFFLRHSWGDTYNAAGACLFILLVQDPRMRLGLTRRLPMYLGRISYSSYLAHSTVLFTLLNLFYGKMSLLWLTVLFGVTTLVVAHMFCVLVEEPSLRLGKRLTRPAGGGYTALRWSRSRPTEGPAEGGM